MSDLSLPVRSRLMTRALMVGSASAGTVLFVAPGWAAPRFAWQVTELMVMTIGAWFLGNAMWAWRLQRDWVWARVGPGLVYLWCFGLFEVPVVIAYQDKVRLTSWVAWLYLAVIALFAVAGMVGLLDVVRTRPARDVPGGEPFTGVLRALAWTFLVLDGLLCVVALTRPSAAVGGGVFPEDMSPFTLRTFGAYFLALAFGAVVVLRRQTRDALLENTIGGLGIIAPILVAAVVYRDVFDFAAHPGQWIYVGSYVVVFLVAGLVLATTGRSRPAPR